MNEYLLRIKAIVDALSSIGYSILVQDHLDAIFDGFPEEYNAFVISVNTRLDPYTIPKIESLLLAHESRIEALSKSTLSDMMSSNIAHTHPTKNT